MSTPPVLNNPQSHVIAAAILQCREVLNLRTRLLKFDVRKRFGCSDCIARTAIAIARAAA